MTSYKLLLLLTRAQLGSRQLCERLSWLMLVLGLQGQLHLAYSSHYRICRIRTACHMACMAIVGQLHSCLSGCVYVQYAEHVEQLQQQLLAWADSSSGVKAVLVDSDNDRSFCSGAKMCCRSTHSYAAQFSPWNGARLTL
jgi:hypothetical protein